MVFFLYVPKHKYNWQPTEILDYVYDTNRNQPSLWQDLPSLLVTLNVVLGYYILSMFIKFYSHFFIKCSVTNIQIRALSLLFVVINFMLIYVQLSSCSRILIPWSGALLGKPLVAHLLKSLPPFYGTESLLPCSQKPSFGPCPEPAQSSLYESILPSKSEALCDIS
jgi:hypothetical protein